MDNTLFDGLKEKVKGHLEEENRSYAHDFNHILRTISNARRLLRRERADEEVVLYALLFHDYVRDAHHEEKLGAAELSALAAEAMLNGYLPQEKLGNALHSIRAHSRNSTEKPETIEAMVVWDSDKIDAAGKVGVARYMVQGYELKWSIEQTARTYIERWKQLLKQDRAFYTRTGTRIGLPKVYEGIIWCEDILKDSRVDKKPL